MPAALAQDLAALLDPHPFRIGQLVPGSPYRIMDFIGKGGMGCVYEVEHVTLGKRFVLKSLIGAARPELSARLQNEWRALAQLESPHIVAVTDAGACATGAPYFVMERLEGETLRAFMRRTGVIPAGVALRLAAEMLTGLGAAHAVGIIHRDVKPANVFITAAGQVKLLDFGVAKVAFGAQGLTVEGMAVGTPRYMAPEQVRGGPVDGRADVYAVGLILFEMLTSARPFDDRRGVMGRFSDAPSLTSIAPKTPAALDALVARLLAADPRRRPVTALAARQELISVAANLPLGAGEEALHQAGRASARCPRLVERLLAAQGQEPQALVSAVTRVDGERGAIGAKPGISGMTVRLTDARLGARPSSAQAEPERDRTSVAPNDTFPEQVAFDVSTSALSTNQPAAVPRATLEPPTPPAARRHSSSELSYAAPSAPAPSAPAPSAPASSPPPSSRVRPVAVWSPLPMAPRPASSRGSASASPALTARSPRPARRPPSVVAPTRAEVRSPTASVGSRNVAAQLEPSARSARAALVARRVAELGATLRDPPPSWPARRWLVAGLAAGIGLAAGLGAWLGSW